MLKATRKRIIIGIAYLAIFSGIGFGWHYFFGPEATCSDGIKNQNEEDVDCGGVCAACQKIEAKPLEIGETGILDSTISDQYDFYALVSNPNSVYGSDSFAYSVKLKDGSGNVITEKKGSSYILPGDSKYVVETNVAAVSRPSSVEFSIVATDWVEFMSYYERPDIRIVNKTYNEIASGVGFSEATGLLKNGSPYDFASISVKVILKDASGKAIAINSTEMRTVKSGEDRDFRLTWPNRFQGTVSEMIAQPEVNVFSSEAFAQKYFKSQQFQQQYK